MSRQLNIKINYRPLTVAQSIVVGNGLPTRQDFCADTREHTPDFTQTPIVLAPEVWATDPETGETRRANALLEDLAWTEARDGAVAPILPSTPGYAMEPEGSATAGALTVSKNAMPESPIALRFTAVLSDWRQDGARHRVALEAAICCSSSTEFPKLTLSCPSQNFYDPVRGARMAKARATLSIRGEDVPQANYLLGWLALDPDTGLWHPLGTDPLDYWATAIDGRTVAVDMGLMGDEGALRCVAAYNPAGAPSLSHVGEFSPKAEAYFYRRLTAIRADIQNVPEELQNGTKAISPKAVLADHQGNISDPDSIFDIKWTMRAIASGAAAKGRHSLVGQGSTPSIDVSSVASSKGASLVLEVEDRGPLKAWADSDGKLLTDNDGAILLIK